MLEEFIFYSGVAMAMLSIIMGVAAAINTFIYFRAEALSNKSTVAFRLAVIFYLMAIYAKMRS